MERGAKREAGDRGMMLASRENAHPNTGAVLRGAAAAGMAADPLSARGGGSSGMLAAVLRGHTNDGHGSQELSRDGECQSGRLEQPLAPFKCELGTTFQWRARLGVPLLNC